MAERLQVYKCDPCGNIVEVVHGGGGELVCCGQPMNLLVENTTDAAVEKHVPVIETLDHGIKITVGSVPHPMADEHYIEWIEVVAGGRSYTEYLEPGGDPSATFCVKAEEVTMVREYCNLHGHWKA
jgi:superoxide reductase